MDLNQFGKELVGCVQLDEKKLADLLVEKVVLASLHKVALDSGNPFAISSYELLVPLVGPKVEEALAELLGKAGI